LVEVLQMAKAKTTPEYVFIPVEVFEAAETLEDLEDWLIAHNEELLARLREAREEHRRGEVKSSAKVREDLGL
jgi:PHD/YefM family antitoxin component YafN of YafNO toxin-antitoxin module